MTDPKGDSGEVVALGQGGWPVVDLQHIREVRKMLSWRMANRHLDAGYLLLRLDHEAQDRKREDGTHYIARGPVFILGRTADVPPLDLESRDG